MQFAFKLRSQWSPFLKCIESIQIKFLMNFFKPERDLECSVVSIFEEPEGFCARSSVRMSPSKQCDAKNRDAKLGAKMDRITHIWEVRQLVILRSAYRDLMFLTKGAPNLQTLTRQEI